MFTTGIFMLDYRQLCDRFSYVLQLVRQLCAMPIDLAHN